MAPARARDSRRASIMTAAFQPSTPLSQATWGSSSASASASAAVSPCRLTRRRGGDSSDVDGRELSPRTGVRRAVAPVCAQTTPRAPATTAPPFNPRVLPATAYPEPHGESGALAAISRECATIPDLFQRLAGHPRLSVQPALVDEHHGAAVTLTYAQLGAAVRACAAGLRQLGLADGDIVSLFSENSYRWFVVDQGIMSCGAAAAVRGVAAPVSELRFIFENSRSAALFVEHRAALERVVASGVDLTKVKFIMLLFGSADECKGILSPNVRIASYDDVMQMGVADATIATGVSATADSTFASLSAARNGVATLLYTSGTTGNPKGVVLTHENILRQLEHITLGTLDPLPGHVFVSVLPCWHVFERTAAYWCLSKGLSLVYSNKRRFRNDLVKYRPHILISVPRVFENLHAAIIDKLRKASLLRKALFALFMSVSLAFVRSRRRVRGWVVSDDGGTLRRLFDVARMVVAFPLYALANWLLWRKIRHGLGGRLRICLSGGGRIAGHLEDFFESAGISICVGYGLTETSPVIANRFGERNVRGTTGLPMPGTDVKLVEEGSGKVVGGKHEQGVLHVRGPSVFREYWCNQEATASAFDADGFFDTGDLAYYGDGGDIVICGRSKDVIVLSNGENIEPAVIEDALLASRYIDQVMLVGQDERALGALVVPQLDELVEGGFISEHMRSRIQNAVVKSQGQYSPQGELRQVEEELTHHNDRFWDLIRGEIRQRNQQRDNYSPVDNIVYLKIVLQPFSVENGMMTQTLKIKKDVVLRVYESVIAAMSLYQNDQVIAKLTRIIMKDGKKHCALQILDDCFALLRSKYSVEDPASFTRACVQIAKPVVETRKYVIGGRTIGVPTPCRPQRQESLALRFIRDSFRKRKEFGSGTKLAKELLDLNNRTGGTYRMRDEMHKRAEANRGFAHFMR